MNIGGIQYSIKGKVLEIYLSGCDGACEGCHNKELWDYRIGSRWDTEGNRNIVTNHLNSGMVDNVWVMGGEPLLQNTNELDMFLWWLTAHTDKPFWLFTRFEIDEVQGELERYFTYIKTGKYIRDLGAVVDKITGLTLASSNQRIHKLK